VIVRSGQASQDRLTGTAGAGAEPDAVRFTLPTAEDTGALGRALADLLVPGDLIVLTGPLGAGKTVLVQGLGAGLGVGAAVTSPTFVIARVHRGGRLPLVHADAYRLGSVSEVDDLDLDADLDESVTVVEWGGGLVEHLADAHLEVRLERSGVGDTRTAELLPRGGTWSDRLARLRPDAPGTRPGDRA
jgi:tRNA threonylcarbamoyladenosine biosynthesis protein TsaE